MFTAASFTESKRWEQFERPLTNGWISRYIWTRGILSILKKTGHSDTRYSMDGPWRHDAAWKEPGTEDKYYVIPLVWGAFCGQIPKTKGRVVVARYRKREEWGGLLPNGNRVSSGNIKQFWMVGDGGTQCKCTWCLLKMIQMVRFLSHIFYQNKKCTERYTLVHAHTMCAFKTAYIWIKFVDCGNLGLADSNYSI